MPKYFEFTTNDLLPGLRSAATGVSFFGASRNLHTMFIDIVPPVTTHSSPGYGAEAARGFLGVKKPFAWGERFY